MYPSNTWEVKFNRNSYPYKSTNIFNMYLETLTKIKLQLLTSDSSANKCSWRPHKIIPTQVFSTLHPPASHHQRKTTTENHNAASRRHWWHHYNSKAVWTIPCLKQLPSNLTSQKRKTKTNKQKRTPNHQLTSILRLQQVTFFLPKKTENSKHTSPY